jgi:hypothetical protein
VPRVSILFQFILIVVVDLVVVVVALLKHINESITMLLSRLFVIMCLSN